MAAISPIQPVLDRAVRAFGEAFGGGPRWAAAAPGRVNLIGEHTDYNDGLVLPIAIDRVCVALAAPAGERSRSRIISAEMGCEATADLRSPLRAVTGGGGGVVRGDWSSYILGVMAQFQGTHRLGNLDMAVASSVPLGAGLSSSASVEVSVASVMEQVVGARLGPLAKARLCQRAEHEFAGVPCGIMDQLVSVFGREGHALLIDCETQAMRHVPMPPDAAIVVVNSNVRHSLAAGEYAARRAACAAAAGKLGIRSLRHARLDMCGPALTPEELRCVRHVVTENERTSEGAGALASGDVERFGRLMVASHASLRDDYRVSCRELDAIVEAAMGQDGVLGARMTGGGFGGCVVVLARPAAVGGLRGALRELPGRMPARDGDDFVVCAMDGARAVAL